MAEALGVGTQTKRGMYMRALPSSQNRLKPVTYLAYTDKSKYIIKHAGFPTNLWVKVKGSTIIGLFKLGWVIDGYVYLEDIKLWALRLKYLTKRSGRDSTQK